uniref:Amyloid beta (A4) precursor-like protein 1 n=1 Tax=Amphiprion ocellaris TaxID=80972 RepID=A0AAQ5YKW6_AMPOC
MGHTVLPILMAVLSHCVWENVEALAMAEVNGPGPQLAEPQIAMFCGRQLLHMNIQTGQWEPDPQGRQGCFKEPGEILSYCQEMYPALPISHIEESKRPVTIPAWCKKGWGHCQTHPFIVLPYRCLEGEYVSEALLVPDRCRFLHQEQMDACKSYVYWHNIAKEECTADNLELHSYGMLLPCGDHFRGVEYVCCPSRGSSSGKGETEDPSPDTDVDEADMEEEDDEVLEEEEEEEEEEVDEEEAEEEEDEEAIAVKDPEEYEYPIDSGPYQTSDYLDSFYYEKSHKPTTSAPLMKGDSLTTPRPTDGVDVYFEKPADDTEHANFLRAKTDLEERRMKRINEIMKEWAEADNQSKNLPKSERQALNEHFQSVLQTLEEQVAGERQRLVETHLERVEAILNNNRRLALENYLAAVQADPPQPERVLQALKRYMAAEQKDRRHTLRHYQHIVAVDPQKAEQMKFQVYTHLHVIEERMNQSLALLYKDPTLAEELHNDIQELVKAERGDISELMTTSFSETRTTEELLPAESEEEKDDEEEEERAFQNRPYPPRIGTYLPLTHVHAHIFHILTFYSYFSCLQVDPMLTPEERQLNKMQNHGYENPTYKFFEQIN